MNKRWMFLALILCMAFNSFGFAGHTYESQANLAETVIPTSEETGQTPPAETPTPETVSSTPTAEQTLTPGDTSAPVQPTTPVMTAVVPTEEIAPTTAPEQAQVINAENSSKLTLKRQDGIGWGSLQKLIVSPDGKNVLLSYSTRLVLLNLGDLSTIWEVDPGRILTDITFTKDGSHLVSCSPGGTVQIIDAATGAILTTSIPQREGVRSMALSDHGEYFAILDYTGISTVWNISTGKQVQDNNGAANPGGINAIFMSPGGGTLLIDGIDSKVHKQVQQWNVTDGKFKIGLLGVLNEMVRWKFSPDARRIFGINTRSLTAQPANTLVSWNSANGVLLKTYDSVGLITDYKISPDGTTLLIATEDNQIHVLDVESGGKKGVFAKHTTRIAGMDFTPDSQGVVSLGVDGKLYEWNVANQKADSEHDLKFATPRDSMMFSSQGQRAALLSPDQKKLGVMDVATLSGVQMIGPEEISLHIPALSPRGDLAAAIDAQNGLNIWDVTSGKKLQTIPTKTRQPVKKIKFSPDGKLVATLSEGQIFVWDAATGSKVREVAGQNDFDFSPVEKILASDSTDNRLFLTNLDTGKTVTAIPGDHIDAISYSPGGDRIAIGGQKVQAKERGLVNLIYQIDLTSKQRLPVEMPELLGTVSSMAYSPNMDLLAASDSQGNIYLWNLMDGKRTAFFEELAFSPSELAFNKEGTELLVGGGDGTIGVISTTGGETAGQPKAAEAPGESTIPELSSTPYTHTKGSVTVQLPQGWNLKEPSDLAFVSSEKNSNGIVAFVATNTINPLTDEGFLNYISGCEAQFAISVANYKETDRGIDTRKGSGYVTKTVSISGIEYFFETYYTRDGSIVYQVNFFTRKPYIETYLPIYQGIYASLKINKAYISKQMPYEEVNTINGADNSFVYAVPTGWISETMQVTDTNARQYSAPDKSALMQVFAIPWDDKQMIGDTEIYASMQTWLETQEGTVTIVNREKTETGGWQITYALPEKNRNGVITGLKIGTNLQTLNVEYPTDLAAQYSMLAAKLVARFSLPK